MPTTMVPVPPILVAEDDAPLRSLLRTILSEITGRPIQVLRDGKAVLAALERQRPCILLVDILLPDMDGLALARRVKQRNPDLPVIAMSAGSYRDAALSAGCDGFLVKPFELEELIEQFEVQLGTLPVPVPV